MIFVASQSSLSAEVKTVIKQQLEKVANGWTVYRIARQASRMVNKCEMCLYTGRQASTWLLSLECLLCILHFQGCHEFSSELYQSLRTRVASEHFYFWLNSLKEFSQAEQCLSHVEDGDYSGAMSAIAEALRSYQKGIASLTVSLTAGSLLSKIHHHSFSVMAGSSQTPRQLRVCGLCIFKTLLNSTWLSLEAAGDTDLSH